MKHQRRPYFSRTRIGGILTVALLAALLFPGDAFCQVRHWSTVNGKPSFWRSPTTVTKRYSRPTAPTASAKAAPFDETSENSAALDTLAPEISDRSQARASLRDDWDAAEIERRLDTDAERDATDSKNPKGVTVELYIDARTNAHLREMSAQTGIPFKKLLYKFLRIGEETYSERLFWSRSPHHFSHRR